MGDSGDDCSAAGGVMKKKDETLEGRLLRCTRKGRGCWEWTGAKSRAGYGQFGYLGNWYRAHRVAYLVWRGPLKRGLYVCHRCDNPGCVRPSHLFLGTNSDNIRDSLTKGRHYHATRTHCPRGHAYTGDNLIVTMQSGGQYKHRQCRACHRIKNRRWGRARQAAAL